MRKFLIVIIFFVFLNIAMAEEESQSNYIDGCGIYKVEGRLRFREFKNKKTYHHVLVAHEKRVNEIKIYLIFKDPKLRPSNIYLDMSVSIKIRIFSIEGYGTMFAEILEQPKMTTPSISVKPPFIKLSSNKCSEGK